jgi:hypothetical protein
MKRMALYLGVNLYLHRFVVVLLFEQLIDNRLTISPKLLIISISKVLHTSDGNLPQCGPMSLTMSSLELLFLI